MKLVLDLSYGAASFVMPNLLSKVAADVLSINPYAQTPGMISVDRSSSAARVADAVRGSGADLGAVIDAGGEHLTLIDGTGRVLSDDEALMVFFDLLTAGDGDQAGSGLDAADPVRVALPVTASDRAVAVVRGPGRRGRADVAVAVRPDGGGGGAAACASRPTRRVASSSRRFLPSFDAAGRPGGADRPAGSGRRSLAQVVGRVPAMPILHAEVETPFEQKGLVMRTLMEQLAEEEPTGADRRHQGAHRGRVGAGGARPRGADDPCLGRGRRPGRLERAHQRLRGAGAPLLKAESPLPGEADRAWAPAWRFR